MKRKQKILVKIILRPVYALIGVVIFLSLYNHYLLDKSFVNLKLSLKKLESAQSIDDIKKLKGILDDTFLMEIAKQDLDVVSLIKLEAATTTIGSMTSKTEAESIKQTLQDTAREKEKRKNPIVAALDNLLINFTSKEAKDDSSAIRDAALKMKNQLTSLSGERLQDKYIELSKLYVRLKDFKEAKENLEQCVNVAPASQQAVKAYIYLGLIYKLQGDFAKAQEMFHRAKANLPEDLKLFASFQEADTLNKMGNANESAKLFEKIAQLNPSGIINQLAQFRAGNIYLNDLGDLQKADEAFQKLRKMSPENNLSIAQRYRENGYKLLEDGYRFLKVGKDPDAAKKNEQAVEQFASALKYVPLNVKDDMRRTIGEKYRELGFRLTEELFWDITQDKQISPQHNKNALEYFDTALEYNKLDGISHSGKGLSLFFLKNNEKALIESKKAKELSPNNEIVRANLGFVYYQVGMPDEARHEYENAVSILPNSALLQYDLGTLYLGGLEKESVETSKRTLDKAVTCFKNATNFNPYFPYAYNNYGFALWIKKNYVEAKNQFQKAISLKADYVDAHYNMACVYFALGSYVPARDEFLTVKKLKPNYKKTDWYLQQVESLIK